MCPKLRFFTLRFVRRINTIAKFIEANASEYTITKPMRGEGILLLYIDVTVSVATPKVVDKKLYN